jgi:hypothetical protein
MNRVRGEKNGIHTVSSKTLRENTSSKGQVMYKKIILDFRPSSHIRDIMTYLLSDMTLK